MSAPQIKISPIHAGMFQLDGGAMFGIVPKRLWNKINPSDEFNMCTWALRCLLIEYGDRKILVDTGMGNKQDEKFRSHFNPHGDKDLLSSLSGVFISPEQITDVFLTHLHFDHCGGAVSQTNEGTLKPAFPNATYWSNQRQWDWALDPNAKERASFLKENFVPLQEAGILKMIDVPDGGFPNWISSPWGKAIEICFIYGHTEAMMGLKINNGDETFLYVSDLMPSHGHIGMPYVMSYDIRPLITLEEKKTLFKEVLEGEMKLIFEHDPVYEGCTLIKNDRGRIVMNESIEL